jgi:EAL domain-containing protein (putative c-di-GMP-specific phosphodiesterase class I)
LVKECGLESYLEIEVTEGVMMKNIAVTLDIMHKLKAIGCKLSIDDFGTGYSSLGYISRFPLDKLKIDQSFVRAMLTSQTNMAIVDTIIRLANNLHLRVIAEGVETAEEMAALAARRCDEVQGYYFAKPMPAEELSRWWADWNQAVRA